MGLSAGVTSSWRLGASTSRLQLMSSIDGSVSCLFLLGVFVVVSIGVFKGRGPVPYNLVSISKLI